MSTPEFVPLEACILEAFEILDEQTENNRRFAMSQARYAVEQMYHGKDYYRDVAVAIEGVRIPKPCDYLKLRELVLLRIDNGIDNGHCITHMSYPLFRGHASSLGAHYAGANAAGGRPHTTKVNTDGITFIDDKQNGCFALSCAADNLIYTHAGLTYIGSPVNDKGELMIHHAMEQAVVNYIVYRMLWKKKMKNQRSVHNFSVQQAEKMWLQSKATAVGEMRMPNLHDRRRAIDYAIGIVRPPNTHSREYEYNTAGFTNTYSVHE